jgi:hypothetical protein
MQYMLLIYGDEAGWNARTDDELRTLSQGYEGLTRDLVAAGKLAGAGELQPVGTATTLRVRNGDAIVSDGPFAETKEVLGGYYLIESESLDEALQWAERIPDALVGTVEIRPVVDHSGSGS